jgi:hypothetical protein
VPWPPPGPAATRVAASVTARMLLRLALASCVAAVLLTTAAPALAGTREKILQECQDGRLSGDYTAKEIRDARNNIPTDIDQYSDCRDVLARALASRAGGGGGSGGGAGGGGAAGGGGGGSGPLLTPSSPADNTAIAKAQTSGSGPVKIGDSAISPGVAGLASGAPRTGLPTGTIIVLALLGLAALAAGAPLVRGRLGSLPGLATLGKRVLGR